MRSISAPFLLFTAILSLLLPAHADVRALSEAIPANLDRAYKKGLNYLSTTQNDDGSWNDSVGSEPGIVGLAVLAFLAHGEDAVSGPYAKNIKAGLDFILQNQAEDNGYIGNSMYTHGFATLALAESYGMIDDPRIAPALKKAVDLILSSQKRNPTGGWRYSPEASSSDTSIAGCQIVALLAARNAGIPVPDEAIDKGMKYIVTCRGRDGKYGYSGSGYGTSTLTAIGSLCHSLAKRKDEKLYKRTVESLRASMHQHGGHFYLFYHEYYVAQALFQANEAIWNEWTTDNSRLMLASQQFDGSWVDSRLGKSGATSFALLSMALHYRFLPIYEK